MHFGLVIEGPLRTNWGKCADWFCMHTHTHTRLMALCPGLPGWAGTRKVKTNLDFTEARDSEWQWHQLGHMQVCTLLQTDNHASTPLLSFLQAGCPSCRPTNSVSSEGMKCKKLSIYGKIWNFLQEIGPRYSYQNFTPGKNHESPYNKMENLAPTLIILGNLGGIFWHGTPTNG